MNIKLGVPQHTTSRVYSYLGTNSPQLLLHTSEYETNRRVFEYPGAEHIALQLPVDTAVSASGMETLFQALHTQLCCMRTRHFRIDECPRPCTEDILQIFRPYGNSTECWIIFWSARLFYLFQASHTENRKPIIAVDLLIDGLKFALINTVKPVWNDHLYNKIYFLLFIQ